MLRIRLIDTVIYLTMFLCLAAAYPPRRNKGLCFLAILPFTAASIGMTVLEELLPAGNMLVYLALFVLMGSLFGALFLSGRFIERLILLLMFTCTFEFFNGITLYLDLRLFGSSTYYWRLFDIPLMMLGGYAAYRFALHPRRGLPWFCWLPIIITALLSMAQHLLRPASREILQSAEWLSYRALCSLLHLLILYLSFFICSRMTKYYETYLQLAVNQKIIDSQSELVQESMRLNRELRRQRHEYSHTLTAAQTLLRQQEYDRLAELLRSQADAEASCGEVIHSGNPVADAVLNQKASEAKRQGIPFKADVCLSPDLPLSSAELVSLLANLLDNALEASKAVDAPEIAVHIYPTRCYLCFSVRNRADCSHLDGDNLQTTKANREAHGFGLDLIREIARTHQGMAQFTPSADGVFVADVTVFLGDGTPGK